MGAGAMNRLRSYLSTSLWALPGTMLAMAVAAAISSALLDRVVSDDVRFAEWLFFTGSPEAAREIFSTIAGSMLTITGVVFSITMLVLQLASSQFSPRTLRTFLRDVPSKIALGTFVGTFAFALVGLSTVRSTDDLDFVPRLTVTFAFILVLASLAMFLHYINHTAQKIQVTSIIKAIGEETVAVIEHRLPDEPEPQGPFWDLSTPHAVMSKHVGVITKVEEKKIVHFAEEHDASIEVTRPVGSFVPLGSLLLRSSVPLDEDQQSQLLSYLVIATERNLEQDIAYGFRELTDVALRALSPAVNDATTAVIVIDAQHDLLLRVGRRADPRSVHVDDNGAPRLLTQPVSWEVYLHMVFGEIGTAGKDYERIRRHLEDLANDLVNELPAQRAADVRSVAARASAHYAS